MKLSKRLLTFARILDYKLRGKKYPIAVNISLTNRCNFRCKYCNIPSKFVEEMNFRQIKRVIDKLARYCVYINLHGGEPLLRKDISKIVSYIQSKDGIYCTLFTNASNIKNNIDAIRKIDAVSLSLDGPKELNDKFRCRGSYDNVINSLETLRDLGIQSFTNLTLTKYNAEYVKEFLRLSVKLNTIPLVTLVYNHDLSSSYVDDIKPTRFQVRKVARLLKDFYKKHNYPFMYPDIYLHYPKNYLNFRNCVASELFMHIEPDGSVFPCQCQLTKKSKYNLLVDDPLYIINSLDNRCNGCWCLSNLEFSLQIKKFFNNPLALRLSNNRARFF